MVSFPKSKTRTGPVATAGSYTDWYGSSKLSTYSGAQGLSMYHDLCDGSVMAPPYTERHTLLVEHRKVVTLRINGSCKHSILTAVFDDYNTEHFTGYAFCVAPTSVDWNWLKAKALANINPFSPKIDLPLFLWELRELPRMIKDLGNVLRGRIHPSSVPNGHLSYSFGWAPLISDLGKFVRLGELINQRNRYLRDAQKSGGVKVRRTLVNRTGLPLVWEHTPVSFSGGSFRIGVVRKERLKAWCTATVSLTDSIPEDALKLEAIKTTLGLRGFSPATLWDMIPWTWLIDYFTNFGDLLEARRGYNHWEFKDLIMMATSTLEDRCEFVTQSYDSLSFSGGIRTFTRKQRTLPDSNPTVGIALTPILSGNQVALLGSLAVALYIRRRK